MDLLEHILDVDLGELRLVDISSYRVAVAENDAYVRIETDA